MSIFSAISTYAVLGTGIAIGVVSSSGVYYLYDKLIDDPSVEAEARKGYALESTVEALSKQLEKERYYRTLAEQARQEAIQDLLELQDKQKVDEENARNKILEDTAANGRPSVTQSDIDWLRDNRGPKASSTGSGKPKSTDITP